MRCDDRGPWPSRVSCDTCCTISTDRDSYERGPRLIASEKTNPITWAKSGLYSLGLATIAVRDSKDTHPHLPTANKPSKQDRVKASEDTRSELEQTHTHTHTHTHTPAASYISTLPDTATYCERIRSRCLPPSPSNRGSCCICTDAC